jgi:hypothetical protein
LLLSHDDLFFLDLASRKVEIAGVTSPPHEQWMI